MKILAVGGGSGGHVTPVAVVLKQLSKSGVAYKDMKVWCDRAYSKQTSQKIHGVSADIRVETVLSGKFRRFHSLSVLRQLTRFRTIVFPNIRDAFLIVLGTIQSCIKLIVWRPDVVFCKGGFTSLPVGLAAQALRIPVVLHDSDSHPGLANRILAKRAKAIVTGAEIEKYPYDKTKMIYGGIPIDERLKPYANDEKTAFKKELGFDERPLVLITGGGLGAETLNDAAIQFIPELIATTNIMLLTGTNQYDSVSSVLKGYMGERLQVHAFLSDRMIEAMAAADIVVTRGGATTLLELSALGSASIIVPNPYLTAGHQLKNVAAYEERNAAVVLKDSVVVAEPLSLGLAISELLNDDERRRSIQKNMNSFARYDSAEITADAVLKATKS